MSSILDVFWVELGKGPREDEAEPTEAFGQILKLTLSEVAGRIVSGEIRDGYTIAALMMAQLAGVIEPLGTREWKAVPAKNKDLDGNAPESCPVALLMIDVINDLEFRGGDKVLGQALPMAKRVAALAKKARAAGIPVIYANDNFGRRWFLRESQRTCAFFLRRAMRTCEISIF